MADEQAQAAAHAVFDPIAQRDLALPDIDIGPMFGSEGLRLRGKVYAFVGYSGALIVKLPRGRIDELIAEGTVVRLEMRGRAMREWASCAQPDAATWAQLVDEARDFLDALTR